MPIQQPDLVLSPFELVEHSPRAVLQSPRLMDCGAQAEPQIAAPAVKPDNAFSNFDFGFVSVNKGVCDHSDSPLEVRDNAEARLVKKVLTRGGSLGNKLTPTGAA